MSFNLTILGSSSALPASNRFPTAHVLNVHEHFFLIDCGEGAQIQLRKYRIKIARLNHIFISHLHGDHYFGILGLISTISLLGRDADLHIYSHQDIEKLFNCGLFPIKKEDLGFNIILHPLNYDKKELIYEDKHITVESFPLKHRIPTCGFVFRETAKQRNIKKEMIEVFKIPLSQVVKIKEGADFVTNDGKRIENAKLTTPALHARSFAYCSDTAYLETIIPYIKNVDILYHEATYTQSDAGRAKDTSHSTAQQAATIAKKAEVKKLIIGHFSARYKQINTHIEEARSVFENTYAAEDGNTYTINEYKE